MKRIFNIFSIVLIGLFAFVACSPQASFSDELVSVSLTGTQSTARSLVAENDFDIANVKVWKYTAEKADKGLATGATDVQIALEKDSTGNWMTKALSQGAWNFELFGYSDTEGTVLICSGTAENQTITVANHNVKITVKPSQTAKGNIVVKDDIKIVDKNGKEYSGSEYTKTVKVYNSSSEDVTTTVETGTAVTSGRYKVEVVFTGTSNGTEYTAAKASKYINVYDNLTTTVSGTITETEQAAAIEAEGGMISATSDPFEVTVENGKNKEAVKLEVASTPAGTTNNSKTTVEFPAGSINMGTNTSLTLKVESTSIESASTSYSVETSEGAAVASLSFTLDGAADNSTFTTEEGVVVTTNITTGLTENPTIKYVGSSTGKEPEFVSYDKTTGELKFKVFHFSTYLVLSQSIVAVDGNGSTYSSLKAALESDTKEITVLKDVSMTDSIEISTGKSVNLNGKTIKISSSTGTEVIKLPEGSSPYKVVFKDGSIVGEHSNNIFSAYKNSTLVLDNVDFDVTSCFAGIFLVNGANPASLEVKDSSLDINGAFGIGTNASDPNGTYVSIQIENSTLTITSSGDGEDNVGILCNVPSTVLISGSTISGQRQGIILRSADTTHEKKISNSTIISTGTKTNYYDSGDYLNGNWGQGNEVPLAALVVGDRDASSYPYGTTVELDNVTLEVPNESSVRKGLYIYQDGDDYPVLVTGAVNDTCTVTKEGDAIVFPEARIGEIYYSDFEDAVHAAVKATDESEKTVEVLTNKISLSNAHYPEINGSVTINANGATFSGDVSVYTYKNNPEYVDSSANVNIVINDAKNLTVWGEGELIGSNQTVNITMNNCSVDGNGYNAGLLMYRGADNYNKGTINITLNGCFAENCNTDAIHTSLASSVTVSNCSFENVVRPVNISSDRMGDVKVTVESCTFKGCGTSDTKISGYDYSAPMRVVNKNSGCTMTATIKNNTFSETKSTALGDILLVDSRAGKSWYSMKATIINNGKQDLKVKNTVSGDLITVCKNKTQNVEATPTT